MKVSTEQLAKLTEAHRLLDELTTELEPPWNAHDEEFSRLIDALYKVESVLKFGVSIS